MVDLDVRDRSKEILVYAWGGGAERDDVFLYRWTGKKIQPIEGLDLHAGFPGNGTVVYLRQREVTRSVYDPGKSALVDVPLEWSYIGLNYTVKQSFPLLHASDKDAAAVANVRAGSTVTLLASRVEQTYVPHHWLLFKSETGLVGWVLSSDELPVVSSP